MSELQVNWWESVRVYRRPKEQGKRAVQLFRGQLIDAMHVDLARPEVERPRLAIEFEAGGFSLSWAEIERLAGRPDFPTMI